MATIHARATSSGRIVRWEELKRGRLVDATRFGRLFFTTTLTDVITDLCAFAESVDPGYQIATILPNGFTTSLDLTLVGAGFEIVCSRRLVRGWWWNPFAAEFGSNYDVVVTVNAANDEVAVKALGLLQSRYSCTIHGRKPDISESVVDAAQQRFKTSASEKDNGQQSKPVGGGVRNEAGLCGSENIPPDRRVVEAGDQDGR